MYRYNRNNIQRNGSIPLSINGMLIEIRGVLKDDHFTTFNINNWL